MPLMPLSPLSCCRFTLYADDAALLRHAMFTMLFVYAATISPLMPRLRLLFRRALMPLYYAACRHSLLFMLI